ncbi:hypothetical protein SAMN04488030_2207 [Aliiroseovarius halocynthiae]|uniref:Uncharacterized protein n=1 Tax=Aliiroseovarius halocynthiae TaxID=985055 RepID=A0A545SXR9_9RHOB|nr:hypothetical protein [Aliiroseovarius halocynthiae]TQV69756.1 hypothetical protein FIL88_01415 [Aliiroseovarius halocynthiae]SMR81785.1 hypothetical protein SAMN04488030_2207 [Aliiroseovarius halocynthiae]
MELLTKVSRLFSGLGRRRLSEGIAHGYQLWLENLGNDPEAVRAFLVEDWSITGNVEKPSDIPELPWLVLELPEGSDTYSIIHIKAGELEALGAVTSVKNT